MTIIEKTGDLFTSEADAIGHGVNCKGLMGAGIALTFRQRYPDMYNEYQKMCREELLRPGDIYPYRPETGPTVINIASQMYPGPDARLDWLALGLERAVAYCEERGLSSLAIPRIGCGIGGLHWVDVEHVIWDVSGSTDVKLEVWTL